MQRRIDRLDFFGKQDALYKQFFAGRIQHLQEGRHSLGKCEVNTRRLWRNGVARIAYQQAVGMPHAGDGGGKRGVE